jgi:hypothetical protein
LQFPSEERILDELVLCSYKRQSRASCPPSVAPEGSHPTCDDSTCTSYCDDRFGSGFRSDPWSETHSLPRPLGPIPRPHSKASHNPSMPQNGCCHRDRSRIRKQRASIPLRIWPMSAEHPCRRHFIRRRDKQLFQLLRFNGDPNLP